jgi:deoxyribodipyrimidine photo-lyase
MEELKNNFLNQGDIDKYLKIKFNIKIEEISKKFSLETDSVEKSLSQFDPIEYAKTRNYSYGQVSNFSHLIRHGVISTKDISDFMIKKFGFKNCEKFLQELYWRYFWQSYFFNDNSSIWTNIENYKTGFTHDEYDNLLPEDIKNASTPNQVINYFIEQLTRTGYLHNHARMYLASYIVHFRKIKWQSGAKWFLQNLIDADIPSNNLSFQWIASTFSKKPYIFNLDNVKKYFCNELDINDKANPQLCFSYEQLNKKLFPNL